MAIGEASSFTPDASKAAASAEKIFALIDQEPSIDSEKTDGLKLEQVYSTCREIILLHVCSFYIHHYNYVFIPYLTL